MYNYTRKCKYCGTPRMNNEKICSYCGESKWYIK